MNLEKFRNRLIAMEGGDENGKSTIAQLLVKKLNDNNIPTLLTFQPGDSNYGVLASIMRSLCKDKRWNLHPLSNMYAFYLDRVEQMDKVIIPALSGGKTVVSDRWHFSTTAYQYIGKQIMDDYNMPIEVADWFSYSSEMGHSPDVVFYFSEKILKTIGLRKSDSSENDLFETAGNDFQSRVYRAYEEMANNPNLKFKRIKLMSTPEETLESLLNIEW